MLSGSMSISKSSINLVDEAKKRKFKYIKMGAAMAHPKHEKVIRFYKRMGFLKDSEVYIARL